MNCFKNIFFKNYKFYLFILILLSHFNLSANNLNNKIEIVDGQIIKALSDTIPDPLNGRKIIISRQGNCLACHQISSIDEPFQGDIGPSLDGVGSRYVEGELRLRLVNPYYINNESLMPAFYKKEGLNQVSKKYLSKSILSGQDIEDVISWLITLK